jgi:hypothetical protein
MSGCRSVAVEPLRFQVLLCSAQLLLLYCSILEGARYIGVASWIHTAQATSGDGSEYRLILNCYFERIHDQRG